MTGVKGSFTPIKLSEDRTGTINDTIALVFKVKHLSKKSPSCATLEKYEETPIFISVDITEEAVESVARKLPGSFGPGVTDLEALQGWILKFGEDSTRLRTGVETFLEWLFNGILPWEAYRAFMLVHLIALDK